MLVPELAEPQRHRVKGAGSAGNAREAGARVGYIPLPETPGRMRFPAMPAAQLLALQRAAGNHAVAALLQRAPAAAAQSAPTHTAERSDYLDLLNGFEDLAIAAVNEGGTRLDTVRFGRDLSRAHHAFLEQIRRVLILAQEQSPAARRTAIAEWPALAAKLQAALDHAKQLRIEGGYLATVADNVALVGEKYVHAPHRGPSEVESPDAYFDMVSGAQHLLTVVHEEVVDKRDAVVPLNIHETNAKQRTALGAVQFGGHLTRRHRKLLESLRTALVLARTEAPGSARKALAQWQSIQGELRHVFQRAAPLVGGDVGAIQQDLMQIGEQLIHGGVYAEAHNEAVKETELQAPDLAFQDERLKEAVEGLKEVNKLAEKGMELTGESVIDIVLSEGTIKGSGGRLTPELGHAIFELVKNPGEIHEKLEEFKKKGLIGKAVTTADMADKILALRNAVYKVSFEVIKGYAKKQSVLAAKAGAEALVEHWKEIGKWAGEKLEMLEKVEKVAVVITIVVSAVKIIDFVRQGKWSEAIQEIGTTALSLAAGVAAGAGGSAMIGGIGVVIAAEIEGIHGAAAMIRYCKKANMREAALSFVGVCQVAANVEAQDLVANVKLLNDASLAGERALIEQKLASDTPYWMRHLEALSAQLDDTRAPSLGGQRELRAALGPDAIRILQNPGTWAGNWQSMAEQIRVVFAGANAMAKYAVDHYPRTEKREKGEEEGRGGE
jgi:hypothetical protein